MPVADFAVMLVVAIYKLVAGKLVDGFIATTSMTAKSAMDMPVGLLCARLL